MNVPPGVVSSSQVAVLYDHVGVAVANLDLVPENSNLSLFVEGKDKKNILNCKVTDDLTLVSDNVKPLKPNWLLHFIINNMSKNHIRDRAHI